MRRSDHAERIVVPRAWREPAAAKRVYRFRGQTIASVFADGKEHRGVRRFASRGLVRVRTELALEMCMHNLLVLHRSSSQKQHAKEPHPAREPIAA